MTYLSENTTLILWCTKIDMGSVVRAYLPEMTMFFLAATSSSSSVSGELRAGDSLDSVLSHKPSAHNSISAWLKLRVRQLASGR